MTRSDPGLRILIAAINYAPEETGIAPYTTRIAEGLHARGHEVRVLTTYPHYPQWHIADGYSGARVRERIGQVTVERLRHYVPSTPTGIRRALSELSFGGHALLTRWGTPDVVICPSPALLSSALVQLRSRAAFGIQIQDLYSAGIAETSSASPGVVRALTAVEREVARRADGVAVIHDRFKDRIVEQLGIRPDRVSVIRNWTHVSPPEPFDRAAFRARMGWAERETVVLHAGAMGEKQGLVNVVDAAHLADREGLPLRFVLLGDGMSRAALESRAGGCRAIEIRPALPAPLFGQALRSADVLLVNEKPGVVEMAVPSKLTTYFSTGVPVLAASEAASTTTQELMASGAGVRVVPGDPRALVTGALELREDRERAAALGALGPAYCERVLDEENALDAYDGWVRELHRRRATLRRA